MQVKDMINNVLKTKENEENYIDIVSIAEELGIFEYGYGENSRLKAYWVSRWLCVDTHVGSQVYFLDDTPVFITIQIARKSSKCFYWVSKETYKQVKEYILSLYNQEPEEDQIDLINLEEKFTPWYSLSHYCEFLPYHKNNCYYNKNKVIVIEFKESCLENNKWVGEKVLVKYENEDLKLNDEWVFVTELEFPSYLKQG